MPLVRVNGRNAESFDTFDVAEMTDHRDQHSHRTSWSSRQTAGGGGAAPSNSWYARHTLSPTPEADDLTSIGSSSGGRRSEEADRVGSIPSSSSRGGRDYMPRLSQSSNSNSVGSMSSYHTNSVSVNSDNMHNSHNSYSSYNSNSYNSNSYNSNSYNSSVPLYDTVDNLDEMQQDPRNPFNRGPNTLQDNWGDHISEEDENSVSTMEDSSVSPSVQQQQQSQYQNQHSRSNKPQMQQTPTHRSHRQRQRQPQDADDVSVVSHQSSRQDFNKKKTNNDHIIQQLESQVVKINFELATTKSSLDELQLENRRLTDDKEKLSNNLKLLEEENEQLHMKIERMEKEIILRTMEGTKGVARSSTDQDPSSYQVYVSTTKQRLGKAQGGSLEVPFRSSSDEYHLRPKRGSVCSNASFNELQSDDEGASRGEADCRSVALSDCGGDLMGSNPSSDDLEDTARRGGLNILTMMGGGKKPSVREITKQMKETAISYSSRRTGEEDSEVEASVPFPSRRSSAADNEVEDSFRSSSPIQQESHAEMGKSNDDDIGSNPQGEGEDFNDDDPFSTWSAPGDPKRKEPEQNWLQRGLNARGGDGKNSRQPPPTNENEMMDDPFDSCDGRRGSVGDASDKYTSFADNACEKSDDGDMQNRKKFGLFKGFMGRGR